MVLSVCPSVCGWTDIESNLQISSRSKKDAQKAPTNFFYLSDTMDVGNPCKYQKLSNSFMNCSGITAECSGMMWALLEPTIHKTDAVVGFQTRCGESGCEVYGYGLPRMTIDRQKLR